jgi:hypothetical protein
MEIPSFSNHLVPLHPVQFSPEDHFEPATFQTYGYTRFTIPIRESDGNLEIRARSLVKSDEKRPPIRVRWLDNTRLEGDALVESELGTEFKAIELPIRKPGNYELLVLSMARLPFEIILPKRPLAVTKMTAYQPSNQDLYFFVPSGTTRVIFRTGTVPGGDYRTRVVDEDGNAIALQHRPSGNENWFSAENPDPSRNRIWRLLKYRNYGYLDMITVPQSLALTPDTLLVPQECVEVLRSETKPPGK